MAKTLQERFPVGSKIQIVSKAKDMTEWNGRFGVVVGYNEAIGWVTVRVEFPGFAPITSTMTPRSLKLLEA